MGRSLEREISQNAARRGLAVLSSKLTLRGRILVSFVAVTLLIGMVWSLLGVGLIHRSLPQVQDVLAVDLSAALEVYRQHVSRVTDAVRLMAQQPIVRQHIERGDAGSIADPLESIRQSEGLDILILTDAQSLTLFPRKNQGHEIEVAGISTMVDRLSANAKRSRQRSCFRPLNWQERAQKWRSAHGLIWSQPRTPVRNGMATGCRVPS